MTANKARHEPVDKGVAATVHLPVRTDMVRLWRMTEERDDFGGMTEEF